MRTTTCSRGSVLAAFFGACLLVVPVAKATVVPFNLQITVGQGNQNFGTGADDGDTYAGLMFFEEVDLTPEGNRRRSTVPGGDTLTIAGVSFDALLNDPSWFFRFEGGAPECFNPGHEFGGEADPCGPDFPFQTVGTDATGALTFRPNSLGIAREPDALGGDELNFRYSFSADGIVAEPIPEPQAALLFVVGLIVCESVRRNARQEGQ
jgi:hypothetical protein